MTDEAGNRPTGAKEGDFSDLSDWTITDIATAHNTKPNDRRNAEAEIARRQEAGEYDLDAEHPLFQKDFAMHGYGINEDGEILYPTDEYREYAANDYEGPRPKTQRETLAERARTALETAIAETRERAEAERIAQNKANIEAIEDDFYDDESPMNEPMPNHHTEAEQRPEKNPNLLHKEEMEEAEKGKFHKRNIWEKTPKAKKFEAVHGNLKGFRGRKFEKNQYYLPTERDELIDAEARTEGVEAPSLSKRADMALDYAKFRAKKVTVESLYTEGALDAIAQGDFSFNPNYIYDGFKSLNGKQIDLRAGPMKDIVWDSIRHDEVLPTIESPEQLERLEREAVKTAVEIGATRVRDGKTGEEHVEFALPIEKLGEEKMSEVAASFGLSYDGTLLHDAEGDPEEIEKAREVYEAFESGFVNIIDETKDNLDSQEGFKELNWYFDHLLVGYSEGDIAERVLNIYQAAESSAFVEKFNQFMNWRAERLGKTIEEPKDEDLGKEDAVTIDFVDVNSEAIEDEETIYPLIGKGAKRVEVKGVCAKRNPDDYGARKSSSMNINLEKIKEIPGFEPGDPFLTISKPFYIRNYYKEVVDENGKKGKILERSEAIPAHYDKERGAYVSDETGKVIDSQNIRRYKSAYFKIDGVPVSIKESVTNMCGRMFIVFGEDAAQPDLDTFHGSISGAVESIRKANRKIIAKNHRQYVKDGVKGYHTFEPMWDSAIREMLKEVKRLKESMAA